LQAAREGNKSLETIIRYVPLYFPCSVVLGAEILEVLMKIKESREFIGTSSQGLLLVSVGRKERPE
jgi:hypothetical protein